MENGFEIGGRKFKMYKMDAFKQFHIVRRMTPILTEMLPAMKTISRKKEGQTEEEKLDDLAKFLTPVMEGLSKLSDEDANRVLYGLLSACDIQQTGGNWAKIATDSMLMMQDLELPVLLQAAGKVFMYNLSGFFVGLPSS